MDFNILKKTISLFVIGAFTAGLITPPSYVQAQTVLDLPVPGSMVGVSSDYHPTMIKGINIYPDSPLKFDFVIEQGQDSFTQEDMEEQSKKLIKYFLAALTIPEEQMWVNLSPYEKNRIIPEEFGKSTMGRDLLAQDYMLKQLSASLMYPESTIGKEFWRRVYTRAEQRYGTINIPINTFNKIWIVPQVAEIYEHEKGAYLIKSSLKVMLEEDYLALEVNKHSNQHGLGNIQKEDLNSFGDVSLEIVRQILIPEIEKEVNEGKTFANLRQIFTASVLAKWYKKRLKDSLLGMMYVDRGKTSGIDYDEKNINQKIYDQYVESFQRGVFNYIKEDYDKLSQSHIPKKYFSGGVNIAGDFAILSDKSIDDLKQNSGALKVTVFLDTIRPAKDVKLQVDAAMLNSEWISRLLYPMPVPLRTMLANLMQLNLGGQEVSVRYFEGGMQQFDSKRDISFPVKLQIHKGVVDQGLSQKVIDKIVRAINDRESIRHKQERGVSLTFSLAEDEQFFINGKLIKGIRLKGVTYKGGPPIMQAYERTTEIVTPHLASMKVVLGTDGREKISFPPLKQDPTGTKYMRRVVNEDLLMNEAKMRGINTDFSLGFGEFINWSFNGEAVGFVIIGLENIFPPSRIGTKFKSRMGQKSALRTSLRSGADLVQNRYDELNRNLRSAARILAKLHQQGMIHNNPHMDQFEVIIGEESKILDFEDAMHLRELSKEEFILRMLRDFKSLLLSSIAPITVSGESGLVLKERKKLLGLRNDSPHIHFITAYLQSFQRSIGKRFTQWRLSTKAKSVADYIESLQMDSLTGKDIKIVLEELKSKGGLLEIIISHAENIYDEHSPDKAQKAQDLGGIDLNPDTLELRIQNESLGLKIQFDEQLREEIKGFSGVSPVIIDISPIKNLPLFLGFEDLKKEKKLSLLSKE